MGGEASSDEGDDEMTDAEPELPAPVNLLAQLPPPEWTLRCKHWLPAEAPAAVHAAVPNGSEKAPNSSSTSEHIIVITHK